MSSFKRKCDLAMEVGETRLSCTKELWKEVEREKELVKFVLKSDRFNYEPI